MKSVLKNNTLFKNIFLLGWSVKEEKARSNLLLKQYL